MTTKLANSTDSEIAHIVTGEETTLADVHVLLNRHLETLDAAGAGSILVDLRATDPRPYEQMMGFYIREKKYEEAHEICERYFDTDNWKQPQFVGTSLKMLEKFQKLENKLAKQF